MLDGCTISGNSAESIGGLNNEGTTTLEECTISGNSAVRLGGAVFNNDSLAQTTTTLDGCTISGNSSADDAGGLYNRAGAAFHLTDTIVAGNVGSDGAAADIGGPDPSGVTGTYNLIGDGGSGGIQGGSDGNIVLTSLIDLGLAPLGNYGGPTQTMALLAGSPALGAGTPISGITADQRGEPIGSSVDIGAFQGQESAPAITSADNTTFIAGSPDAFTVTATGSPVPTLSESGTLPSGVNFDASTGVLSGTPATTDLGGTYTVTFTASNGVGSAATQEFDLLVVSPSYSLNAPTKFVVTGVTSTSIAFSWTDNDPSATGYDVQEAVAGSSDFAAVTGSPFGPGTTSATATGLASGTMYQFEIRAVSPPASATG